MGESTAARDFLPAAGRAPLALYDLAVAAGMRERTFRRSLVAQVLEGRQGLGVVDVGCGTGTLAIALAAGGARVTGIDPDPRALARAAAKPGSPAVEWLKGHADAIPLADASVDRVVLSLVLHHLSDADKHVALVEAARVLRSDGVIHVAEWTKPGDPLMALAFRGLQLVDGTATTASMGRGELPGMLAQAGFTAIVERDRLRTAFGRLALVCARCA